MGITDNVVDLVIRKMKRLPEATVHALRLAACVGNRFELSTLSTISELPRSRLFQDLLVAVQEGLVLPTSRLEASPRIRPPRPRGLPLQVRPRPRAAGGLRLHRGRGGSRLSTSRSAASCCGAPRRRSSAPSSSTSWSRSTWARTWSPIRTSATPSPRSTGPRAPTPRKRPPTSRRGSYLSAGLRLLGPACWEESYELAFNLHVATVEVLYLNAQIAEAKRLSDEILHHAKDPLEKARVYELQMMASVAQNEHAAALVTAREALLLLGLRLPLPDEAAEEASALRRDIDRQVTHVPGLIDLPEMTDPYHLAKLRILIHAASPAYNAAPALLPAIIFNSTKLCVEHGNAPVACAAYVWHALVVGGFYADTDGAYSYGQLAVAILEKYNAVELKAKIHNLFNAFVRQWKEHVRETMAPMMEGFHSGMQTGDIEFGLYSAIQYCNNLLFIGDPLRFVARQRGEMHALAVRLKQNYHEDYFSVGNQMVLNLLGRSEDPCLLVGEVLDERQKLPSGSR